MYQMNNRNIRSRKLRELLDQIKHTDQNDYDGDYDLPSPDTAGVYNSHTLYQEAANKITAEQDIKLVKEIALYYLSNMCSVMPDHAATMVFARMEGV